MWTEVTFCRRYYRQFAWKCFASQASKNKKDATFLRQGSTCGDAVLLERSNGFQFLPRAVFAKRPAFVSRRALAGCAVALPHYRDVRSQPSDLSIAKRLTRCNGKHTKEFVRWSITFGRCVLFSRIARTLFRLRLVWCRPGAAARDN